MPNSQSNRVEDQMLASLKNATWADAPYRHCLLSEVLPADTLDAVQQISFPVLDLQGRSGKRELHNDQRHYFDDQNIAQYDCIADIAAAFHGGDVATAISDAFNSEIDGTYLRIEYAQDVSGFWLQPHTDLGVKRFTMLVYLSDEPDHDMLGTDIYSDDKTWAKRSPFSPNLAMAFTPGDNTYHGFEPRDFNGVRKSLIINYVTNDWRERGQLSFSDKPVQTH